MAHDPVPLLASDRVNLRRRRGSGEGKGKVVGLLIVRDAFEHAVIERRDSDQRVLHGHAAFPLVEDALIHPGTTIDVEGQHVMVFE
jgi:hypothetical protein